MQINRQDKNPRFAFRRLFEEQSQEQQLAKHNYQCRLKKLCSVKNLHELKTMKLGDDLAYTCDAIDSVKKLENENDELLRLLQILKVSAISALVEKEQQMTQMKEREDMNNQERIEYYEQQLEDAKRKIQDALEVIHEIQSEADYVKANLIAEIKEKQHIIEKLLEEKEEYRLELEKCEVALNIKNTLIEQLEIKILNMVRKKQSSSGKCYEDICDLVDTFKSPCTTKGQLEIIQSLFSFEDELQEVYMCEKIRNLRLRYDQRINTLREYYQKKITQLLEKNQKCSFNPNVQQNKQDVYSNHSRQIVRDRWTETNIRCNGMQSIDEKMDPEHINWAQNRFLKHSLKEDIALLLTEQKSVCGMHSSEIDSQCTKKYICSGNTANRSQERVVPNDHDETRNNGPREKALSWRVKLSFAIGLLSGGAMVYFLPKLLWKYK